jgi:hypothetical protein
MFNFCLKRDQRIDRPDSGSKSNYNQKAHARSESWEARCPGAGDYCHVRYMKSLASR